MSNYYTIDGISQSMIKTFLKSRLLYKSIYVDKVAKIPDSDEKKQGRFIHTKYYEPLKLDSIYSSIPESSVIGGMMGEYIIGLAVGLTPEEAHIRSGFTKSLESVKKDFEEGNKKEAYKTYYNYLLNAQGKEIVSDEWFTTAERMKDVYTRDNKLFLKAFSEGWSIYNEQEINWRSNFSSLQLKSKIDRIYINPDFTEVYIEDLKTTNVYNLSEFIYNIKKFGYDIQQGFYKLAVQDWILQKFNVLIPYHKIQMIFIPQRINYPYNIIDFVEINYEDENKASERWYKALMELEECMITDNWGINTTNYQGFRKIISL